MPKEFQLLSHARHKKFEYSDFHCNNPKESVHILKITNNVPELSVRFIAGGFFEYHSHLLKFTEKGNP